MVTSMNTNCSN